MNTEQILKLEPSPEADRAFSVNLLGWRHNPYPRGDNCYWDADGNRMGVPAGFCPTTGNDGKGDPACWWLGVERLRGLGLIVVIGVTEESTRFTVFPEGECKSFINNHDSHFNPGIALLRAGVKARLRHCED